MVDYSKVPVAYMKKGIEAWVEHGIRPGSFLTAALENNFVWAALKADAQNSLLLREWALFIFNELPGDAWGSPEKLKLWEKKHGR